MLTGRPFSAEDACEWGMVNRLCEAGAVVKDALETAAAIAANAPISIRQAKRSMHYGINMSLADGMLFEIEAYNRLVPTEDRREGIARSTRSASRSSRAGDRSEAMTEKVALREVGMRDGLQSLPPILTTEQKIAWCAAEVAAGVTEIEVTSFVPPKLLPSSPTPRRWSGRR